MNCLIVSAHPLENSLCQAFTDLIQSRLAESGHKVVLENLYKQNFDPVLSAEERNSYYADAYDFSQVNQQVERLGEAEAVVLVFPTWWFGFPAILKGWFDRVWAPGVAYDHATDFGPIRPRLDNLKKIFVVTTLGAPWWVDFFVLRKPVKKILRFALMGACAKNSKLTYLSFYKCEKINRQRLASFNSRIKQVLQSW